jgi:Rrf2 family protein
MLEIRRETDYAIRCVYYLAGKQHEVTMTDEIAREMSIPRSFLAKILQKLSRGGIVRSYQGIKGGFQLSREPEEISLFDIVATMEGPVAMNICTVNKKRCSLSSSCKVHPFWITVRKEVEKALKKVTFKQIYSA